MAVEGRWMSVVTAVDNAVRDIWEVSPWCTVIRNFRKWGSLYIRDLLLILGRGIPLYYGSPSISVHPRRALGLAARVSKFGELSMCK